MKTRDSEAVRPMIRDEVTRLGRLGWAGCGLFDKSEDVVDDIVEYCWDEEIYYRRYSEMMSLERHSFIRPLSLYISLSFSLRLLLKWKRVTLHKHRGGGERNKPYNARMHKKKK